VGLGLEDRFPTPPHPCVVASAAKPAEHAEPTDDKDEQDEPQEIH
jgi:hypothetical protein